MPQRLYYFPIIHCPALCPYSPPRGLFADDYDPAREDEVWRFCGEHCWLSREDERPCLIAFDQRRARERTGEHPHAA